MLCPSDTPEGEACGLVKNLALMTHITNDSEERELIKLAYNFGAEDCMALSGLEISDKSLYMVFLNGNILGMVRRWDYFAKSFKKLRRNRLISEFVSICVSHSHKCIYISSDGGRLCR